MDIHDIIEQIIKPQIKQPLWESWYIEEKIGSGSFSVVYRIEAQRPGGIDVSALKVEAIMSDGQIFSDSSRKTTFLNSRKQMAINEAQIMKKLRDCPYIVRYEEEHMQELYINGEFEGYYYLIRMEFLQNVYELMKKGRFSYSEANVKKLAIEIGQGLKAAHSIGIIHRDIKPDNMFVNDARIYKLGDFNISKKAVSTRTYAGTQYYMAPEIYRARSNVDASYTTQADIYSFGLCLYQMMNKGQLPFEDELDPDAAYNKRMSYQKSFPPPCNATFEFARIILKACSFNPNERYKTIDDMLMDFGGKGKTTSNANDGHSSTSRRGSPTEYAGDSNQMPPHMSNATEYAGSTFTYDISRRTKTKFIKPIAIAVAVILLIVGIVLGITKCNKSDDESGMTNGTIESKQPSDSLDSVVENTKDELLGTTSTEPVTLEPVVQHDYIGKDILSYEHGSYYKEYSGSNKEEFFSLGGEHYCTGFTIGTYPNDGYASYNLSGKYSYISGKAGNVDNTNYSVSYVFYGDGELIDVIDIKGGALPIDFEIPIEGVKQLKIVADQTENYGYAVGFADVVLSTTPIEHREDQTNKSASIAYLGKDIKAYDHGSYYKETNGVSIISLGGFTYHNGFRIGTYPNDGYASFNIEGKYSYFSGIASNVDHTEYGVSYAVYGDDELIGSIDIEKGGLPVEFDLDISGVKQLKIVASGSDNYGNGVGFANAVLYNDENEKPVLYAASGYKTKAFLGKNINAYQNGLYYRECANDGENVSIQGNKYYNGFTIGTYTNDGYASFNLNAEFKTLSGKAGFINEVHPLSYIVYGDGNILSTITLSSENEYDFSIDVTGIKQLRIVADGDSNHGNAVAFADVVVSND